MSNDTIQINKDGRWKLYTNTIPANSTVLGTVTRNTGETGALVQIDATGAYVQVNAGSIRLLDGRAVAAALGLPPAKRGRPETPAHLKREQCNFRLSAWVRDWLVAQPEDAGPLIEAALIERHKLKPPKV